MTSKAERTRSYIIQESAVLFNRQGYAGTSIKDIMQATGLTKGGIYGHFDGKEAIAIAAFEHAVEVVTQCIGERTHPLENTVEKLLAVVDFYREHIFSPPVQGGCPIQNTATESDDNNPKMRQHVVRAIDFWHSRLAYTIQKGIEREEIKAGVDPEEYASLFIGMLEGGILMARITRDEERMAVMTQRLKRIIETELRA